MKWLNLDCEDEKERVIFYSSHSAEMYSVTAKVDISTQYEERS